MFAFDTERPDAFLTEIALGYVEQLEPMRWSESAEETPRGPYLRQIEATHYQPSPSDIESRWLKSTPAAIVHVTGARPEAHYHGYIEWNVSVDVHLFSGHAGGQTEGRILVDRSEKRTTKHDPGIHVMAQHIVEYLHDARPAAGSQSSIFPIDLKRIGDSAKWAWWVYETETKYRQIVNPNRDLPVLDRSELKQQTPNPGDTIAEQRRVF